jgi:hypothetical protein
MSLRRYYTAMTNDYQMQTLRELFNGWLIEWGIECCYLRFLVAVFFSSISDYVEWFFVVSPRGCDTYGQQTYYFHVRALEFILDISAADIRENCHIAGYHVYEELDELPIEARDPNRQCLSRVGWTRLFGPEIDPNLSQCIDNAGEDD